jgi:hypothetical protein
MSARRRRLTRFMPSKPADPQCWLIDIRHNIQLARNFVAGLSCEGFRDNYHGVLRRDALS